MLMECSARRMVVAQRAAVEATSTDTIKAAMKGCVVRNSAGNLRTNKVQDAAGYARLMARVAALGRNTTNVFKHKLSLCRKSDDALIRKWMSKIQEKEKKEDEKNNAKRVIKAASMACKARREVSELRNVVEEKAVATLRAGVFSFIARRKVIAQREAAMDAKDTGGALPDITAIKKPSFRHKKHMKACMYYDQKATKIVSAVFEGWQLLLTTQEEKRNESTGSNRAKKNNKKQRKKKQLSWHSRPAAVLKGFGSSHGRFQQPSANAPRKEKHVQVA